MNAAALIIPFLAQPRLLESRSGAPAAAAHRCCRRRPRDRLLFGKPPATV